MARILAFLISFIVILYGVWPYYGLYRLDQALSEPDAAAIAPFVDLPAIQAHYQQRLGAGVAQIIPESDRGKVPMLDWLADGLRQLGDKALTQVISIDLVRGILREAAVRSTDKRPAYFLAGIDYAFFTSWNGFEVRLGESPDATRVLMRRDGLDWRITDITQASTEVTAPREPGATQE
ncbi:DUF2939 domain-containing protein [Thiocystis violacea]|uniref:DUF2939 domain-containing protein n=1 Tax=Thiocystis violacea TaxID=13725 RepID=UPI00190723BF|nr:DUF2939 domain-containing protein [Thiocystis violacea]MBK1722459.1 hypothetical protein [Thiocystis violacea]